MGGNALRVLTRRMNPAEFDHAVDFCVERLRAAWPECCVAPVVSYHNKESHGDIDIVFHVDNYEPMEVASVLGAVEVVRNGPVTSMGLMIGGGAATQVDIIYSPENTFEFMTSFYAYNDLGGLMGRVARRLGLALKHSGLYYRLFRNGQHTNDVLITRDFSIAIDFLGFSASRWCKGFDDLEDIFRFVVNSRYFDMNDFLLENRDSDSRRRDSKRKTYVEFLAWCEANRGVITNARDIPSRDAIIPIISERFPDFVNELNAVNDYHDRCELARLKFSGKRVMELTGIEEGAVLGDWLQRFRHSLGCGRLEFMAWVVNTPQDEIDRQIIAFR